MKEGSPILIVLRLVDTFKVKSQLIFMLAYTSKFHNPLFQKFDLASRLKELILNPEKWKKQVIVIVVTVVFKI